MNYSVQSSQDLSLLAPLALVECPPKTIISFRRWRNSILKNTSGELVTNSNPTILRRFKKILCSWNQNSPRFRLNLTDSTKSLSIQTPKRRFLSSQELKRGAKLMLRASRARSLEPALPWADCPRVKWCLDSAAGIVNNWMRFRR